ncbi:Phage tail assembly chaperone protein, TAC [Streptococcus equinus]|uniref:Phage tail assembly chaperone protein, TAC n=1 Tax=Streptococcus equinus TaxID=1335 RepID=A0A239RE62_STREI|nr:phage tail tube assembly chaperone [Streptococcus equinus]SNU08716.1 Phage tail assembly chaperone protein, TAC [Streptococcus equinus]
MEIKTITIPELSKKAFKVLTSNRNMKRVAEYQLSVLKISESIEEKGALEQAEAQIKTVDAMLSFIRAILDLDDENYDKLMDLDYNKTQKISEKLVGYMYGLSDEDLEETASAGASDPKEA